MRFELRVRMFFCNASGCAKSIFYEWLPAVLAAYARRTLRWVQVLTLLSLLVSANDAKRLGMVMALPGSASNFLRLANAQAPTGAKATAVGINDFAFGRGTTTERSSSTL